MNIQAKINMVTDVKCRKSLEKILTQYLDPAFGTLPKREIDLLIFEVLQDLGFVNDKPEIYSLISELKISRSKARSLLYDRELRKYNESELDGLVKKELSKLIVSKDGEEFKIELDSQLVSDHLRSKVKKLGYLSDGSFSPSIVKLCLRAITALIESYLSKSEQEKITKTLIKAGAPDKSFKGVLTAVLMKIANKVASDVGESLIEQAEEYIEPIVSGGVGLIKGKFEELFEEEKV